MHSCLITWWFPRESKCFPVPVCAADFQRIGNTVAKSSLEQVTEPDYIRPGEQRVIQANIKAEIIVLGSKFNQNGVQRYNRLGRNVLQI